MNNLAYVEVEETSVPESCKLILAYSRDEDSAKEQRTNRRVDRRPPARQRQHAGVSSKICHLASVAAKDLLFVSGHESGPFALSSSPPAPSASIRSVK